MQEYLKWALLGFTWGIIADIYFIVGDILNISSHTMSMRLVGYIIGWPLILSPYLGFRFIFVFLGSPIIGAIICGIFGYVLWRVKH
jgi:hypothetical protein